MENLRIYLLGPFRLYRDGVLLTSSDWQIRHARQLFKLLFTERGHVVPASKVIDLLWPYSAEHTHKTLRGVVSILRSVLEPGRLSGESSRFLPRASLGYTLLLPTDGTVWVDSIEFERLLDETNSGHESPKRRRLLESALQLYTGDYLAEDEQESWTLAERARLRERYFSTALSLMEAQRKLGLYNEAISVGRRALSFDSCREPFYPIIMYCQVTLEDTVGALQTFEQCRQELHNRLGVDPSPQTLKLHTELLRGELNVKSAKQQAPRRSTSSATSTAGEESIESVAPVPHANGTKRHGHDSHLVGRKDTIDYLLRYIDALQDRQAKPRTRTIALGGEMGSGKSFLLRHILNYARSINVAAMMTECQTLDQGLPFAPLLIMLKAWLAELDNSELSSLPDSILAVLAHLLPELLTRVPGLLAPPFMNAEQSYSALVASFVDLFQALSQQHPLIIAVDNLQWADEASVLVLHRLARFSTTQTTTGQYGSLLLLLSYRPEDVQENVPLYAMLLSLSRCSYFHLLHLSPFSVDEVGDYLKAHTLSHVLSVDQCYLATGGNAFFLAEATRLLVDKKEHETIMQDTSQHLLTTLLRSTKIHDSVLARLARLPERASELLEHASVIARPFPPTLLGSPLSTEDCRLLDMLLTRGFLVEGDEKDCEVCLSFSYELVAKIVYFHCSALKRSLLHLQIAEQLVHHYTASIDYYSKEIAFHYRQAGPQYQAQALQYER